MSGALRLLVTGFGAFGEHAENPSGLMARAVSGRVYHGVEVVAVEVPADATAVTVTDAYGNAGTWAP